MKYFFFRNLGVYNLIFRTEYQYAVSETKICLSAGVIEESLDNTVHFEIDISGSGVQTTIQSTFVTTVPLYHT